MSAPTFLEILADTTPGEWFPNRHGAVTGGVIKRYVNGSGRDQLVMVCSVSPDNAGTQMGNTNLIARCNPATMRAVYEALTRELEDAKQQLDLCEKFGDDDRAAFVDRLQRIHRVICLLDGTDAKTL